MIDITVICITAIIIGVCIGAILCHRLHYQRLHRSFGIRMRDQHRLALAIILHKIR